MRSLYAQAGLQQSGLGLGQGSLRAGPQPDGSVVDMAMAAQHRELAALRDQMAMLRHEMTSMRQGSTQSTPLQPLHQVLRALFNLNHGVICQPSLSFVNSIPPGAVQAIHLATGLLMPPLICTTRWNGLTVCASIGLAGVSGHRLHMHGCFSALHRRCLLKGRWIGCMLSQRA